MRLIFIHGSGGSKESWTFQTRYFKNSEAVDLPGHPHGRLYPTIPEYTAWLKAYIDGQGYQDVVLAGHSLGSGIALQYALDHPQGLKAIISVGGGARLRVHPMYLEPLEKALTDPALWKQTVDARRDRIPPDLSDVLKRRMMENGPQAFLGDMRACDRFDVMNRLAEIHLPALALCGDEDVMTPPKYSHFLADKIPGCRAVIIPGGTHMAFAEKPDEVNRTIEEFLAGL
jgi:pimeloyl-ACP methyl ester carboxylesterase